MNKVLYKTKVFCCRPPHRYTCIIKHIKFIRVVIIANQSMCSSIHRDAIIYICNAN